MDNRCLLIIPARYQSTRLPHKLLLNATGKPLICHTVDMAMAVVKSAPSLFSEAIVATDNSAIMNVVNHYATAQKIPARAQMTRVDHQSGTDRVAEIAQNNPADVIINLQGDEPELDATSIIELAKIMIEQPQIPLATLAYKLSADLATNPNLVKIVCDNEQRALYFSRSLIPYNRDNATKVDYLGHIGIYAYRRATLLKLVTLPMSQLEQSEKLEQLRALSNGIAIRVHQLAHAPRKGIDTPEDYAEFVARFNAKN